VQEPLDNLSSTARLVHGFLNRDPEATLKLEAISEGTALSAGEVADALRELERATRASETFGGWSVLT
jgi:hypothetical protein